MRFYSAPLLPSGARMARIVQVYSAHGPLEVTEGGSRVYNDTGETLRILAVRASVGTPPSGGPVVCDVNMDGVTIFGDQGARPAIPDGQHTSGKVTGMTVAEWPDGSYLTADVDQVPEDPGADLTVQVTVG